ncbi:hypothetical protein JCM8547_003866 [Rhodosporidiobolus lusitaniae]
MSASIRGGLSFTSMSPSSSSSSQQQRKRRPSITGLSYSAPDVPQLTPAERGESARDVKQYPPPPTPGLGPVVHSPFGLVGAAGGAGGGAGPSNAPLMGMTPIASTSASAPPLTTASHSPIPSTSSAASSYSSPSTSSSLLPSASASQTGYASVGHPLAPTPSRLSIASSIASSSSNHTTQTHHTSGGVSRASSCRSTSSVQAVPMRKPQRGPRGRGRGRGGTAGLGMTRADGGDGTGGAGGAGGAGAGGGGGRPLPRIVTRGINALGAYGVGVASPTRAGNAGLPSAASAPPVENGEGPSAAGGGVGAAGGNEGGRPVLQTQRSSWRGRFTSSSSTSTSAGGSSSSSSTALGGGGSSSLASLSVGLGAPALTSLPSPVSEGPSSTASSPSRPEGPGGGPWRIGGSPRLRGREGSSSMTRPRVHDRTESGASARGSPRLGGEREGGEAGLLGSPVATSPRIFQAPPSAGDSQLGQVERPPRTSLSPPPPHSSSSRPVEGRQREESAASGMSVANSMGVVGTRRSTEDFEFGEVLGEGSYSTVTHVTTLHPPYRHYALKVLDKEHIKREKKTKYVLIERDTLKALDGHPGVVKLWWTFQDEWSLYYVLELAQNGELLKWIKRYGSFDLRSARYYVAQVLSAVGYMHEKGVIHRDLKPENILLDEHMRIKITDFGTAKLLQKEELVDGKPADDPQGKPRPRSFVGTPEYVSPEILSEGKESSFSSDFWALGCILFQLLAGRPPFQARTEYLMFQKIINLEYEFPLGFPGVAKDLVEKLLVLDPAKRLGGDEKSGNGIEAIRGHPFFSEAIPTMEGGAGGAAAGSGEQTPRLGGGGGGGGGGGEEEHASTPESVSAPSSFGTGGGEPEAAEHASVTTASTPASSVAGLPSRRRKEEYDDGELTDATSRLSLGSGGSSPRHDADKPLPPPPSTSSLPHPLDGPIDFSTIWTVDPPEIRTGLVQPAPVVAGEFILLDDAATDGGAPSSFAPSTSGTGLTRRTRDENGISWSEGERDPSDEEDFDDDGEGGYYGANADGDMYETASSPTSASGRDLPSVQATFGGGKWSNVLLPSETILMLSTVLARPTGGAAAARTAIMKGPGKLKFPAQLNPRNLISSSPSSSALTAPSADPNALATSPSSANSSFPSTSSISSSAAAAQPAPRPTPPGSKPRTLILTDYPRLLCLKESPHKITVKNEVFLGSALRGGVRREGVSAFICVEPSGKEEGRGFVVKTSSRNYKYDEPNGQAARWIAELREAHRAGLMGPVQPR